MSQDITILIVTYNSENVIETCLSALPGDMRVLLLDNGSRDATLEKAARHPFVEIIKNNNVGYGKAANIGLSRVTTPYALLLNPDVIVHKESIEVMAQAMRNRPELAVASASMFHYENGHKTFKRQYDFDTQGLCYTHWIVGALMLFNMEAFKQVGMFDENIFLFFEETDLCDRFIEAGFKLAICKDAEAEHAWGTSSTASLKTTKIRAWHSAWARAYYYKKHYGLLRSFTKSLVKMLKNMINLVKGLLRGSEFMLIVNSYEIMGLLSFFIGIKAYRKDGTARIV